MKKVKNLYICERKKQPEGTEVAFAALSSKENIKNRDENILSKFFY